MIWAKKVALEAIKEAEKRGLKTITCRCGQSPSGVKHIGNFNDNIRSYFIARLIERFGFKTRHVQTHDDLDPLRTIPRKLEALDGKWWELNEREKENLSKYIGFPLFKVPDPFGCCESWASHFERVWEEGCKLAGILRTEYYKNCELYKQHKFDPFIKKVFEKIGIVREILMRHKTTKKPDYIPFWAICENCGKLTGKVVDFDLNSKTVDYVCSTRFLAGKYEVKSCGYKGTTTWDNGKLDWQLEWPAQMVMFQTLVEGFGKEHYEGSWPLCKEILPKVFDWPGICYFVYEFFLVDGKKMSARLGNVYSIKDMLKIVEPEVLCYFYTKRPLTHRDISLQRMELVYEFDELEAKYFEREKIGDEKEKENIELAYELSWCERELPKRKPFRLPFRQACLLAQLIKDPESDLDFVISSLERIGYVKGKLSQADIETIKTRLKLAKFWVENYAKEAKLEILREIPPEVKRKLTSEQKEGLAEIAYLLERKKLSYDELHQELHRIARRYGKSSFFKTIYSILIGKDHGPRLASLLLALDRDWLIKRLRLEA